MKELMEMQNSVKIPNAGIVYVLESESGIKLYPHQISAFNEMNKKIAQSEKYPYKGLLVLPTGGGKTLTAARWIAQNVLDKNVKVLWLAHRHELLEQAKKTFSDKLAFHDIFKNKKSFSYRIVSGIHDMAVNIKSTDDIIFSSKDSLRSERSFQFLKGNWLKGQDEVFLVIDEAHHAAAKTYRKLIEKIENNIPKFRMLGLTATPFRTIEKEKSYLSKIFPDDMVYKVDLRSLIRQGILSEPKFEEVETGMDFKKDLDEEQIRKINDGFDLESIGFDVAKKIADNNERNRLIVNRYVENKEKYEKTIIFAVNKENVIALNTLFKENGIKSDFVMSDTTDSSGLHNISSKENKDKIKRFRKGGDIDVLINVNILTEGTDVPDVQSVFLTRPTKSTILMTQMMGRALRGEKAGGTKDAYVVTFVDEWSDKISWVNPEKLYIDENIDFSDLDHETRKNIMRLIAISKVEEFAILSDKVIDQDKKALIESVDFIKRIPKGVYKFGFPYYDNEGNPIEKSCEILIYDNLEMAYRNLVADIPVRFQDFKSDDITEDQIISLSDACEEDYFANVERYPAYRVEDIDDLLRYYFQTGETPQYYEFTDRDKYDISKIAHYIIENDLGIRAKEEFIKDRWVAEQEAWRAFSDFTEKMFRREIELSVERLLHPEDYVIKKEKPLEVLEDRLYEDMSMSQIREVNPSYEKYLRNKVFEKYTDKDGYYFSAESGYKSKNRFDFEIDHIKPLSLGGKTRIDNLQLLTVVENRRKGAEYKSETINKATDSGLIVRCYDGGIIQENTSVETFVAAIKKAGIAKVAKVDYKTSPDWKLSKIDNNPKRYQKVGAGLYVANFLSPSWMQAILEEVNSQLDLKWIVEIK